MPKAVLHDALPSSSVWVGNYQDIIEGKEYKPARKRHGLSASPTVGGFQEDAQLEPLHGLELWLLNDSRATVVS